ncbi:hypothetical protein L3Q82_012953, partial [Scortum barcoo]
QHLPLSVTAVTSVISENNTKLTEENQQLKTLMQHLNNQTDTTLTAENQNLKTQIQELVTERDTLTQQITDMETERNELNVSRAQWSIDAYCPKDNNVRQCKPCQKGWNIFQSSCFAFNNPNYPDQKTWEEARENCRGKSSDLAVIVNEAEKNFLVTDGSWTVGKFWIGLRAEGGKWKWLDGSDLTQTSWIQQPAADGLCAIYVKDNIWQSANCSTKQQWICQIKALSV